MSKVIMNPSDLLNKFRGCMLGALIGDCVGSRFEYVRIQILEVKKHIDNCENGVGEEIELTDDTQMTQELAQSLLDNKKIDVTDLARRFTERYFADGQNFYGKNVVDVFKKLRETSYSNPLQPAREQFDGSGSLGNGAAMRVAPVPLFAYPDLQHTADLADQSSEITHTHERGRHGAIFLALGIRRCLLALELETTENFLAPFEEDIKKVNICLEYVQSLTVIRSLLSKTQVTDTEVEVKLGTGVKALRSVPTALFCFLKSLKADNNEAANGFRRTIEYAISLGGDTDTIASMAGALAGAYYGQSGINENIIRSCPKEAVDLAVRQGDGLYEMYSSRSSGNEATSTQAEVESGKEKL